MSNIQKPLLPGFPAISVVYWGARTNDRTGCRQYGIRYCGPQADLIAAGVAQAGIFAPGRRGPGNGRKDADGDPVSLSHYYRSAASQPLRCYQLIIWKPQERLARLPGAIAAILEYEHTELRLCGKSTYLAPVLHELQEDDAAVAASTQAEFASMWQRICGPQLARRQP